MSRKTVVAVAAALVAMTAAAGCTGGSSSSDGGGGSDAAKSFTYLIGQPEEPSTLDKIKANIATFEKESGIDVQLSVLPPDQIRQVLQTQLRSGKGPDLFGYDTGPGFAGVLAKAGLLYDLTDAYKENSWPIYDWAKERVTFDGKLLGVPDQVEEVGVYYNKDIFDEHGIQPPQSLDDLRAASDKLKAEGVIPFAFSDKEGWEAGHILSMSLASSVGSEGMQALINGDTPWTSPEVVSAIDTFFTQFNDAGYLPPSPNAITYDNANSLFYKGEAAMNPTGSWLINDLKDAVDFEVGFFPFPGQGNPGIFAGGLGSGTFVSSKSQAPDSAIAYLDWQMTQEHGRWQVEEMRSIPAFPVDTSDLQTDALFEQVLADTAKISAGTGDFGYNIDVLTTAEFNEAMSSSLQSVLSGDMTAEEAAQAMQDAYESSAGS